MRVVYRLTQAVGSSARNGYPGTRVLTMSFCYPFSVYSTVPLWLLIWCSIPLSFHHDMVSLNFYDQHCAVLLPETGYPF